MILLTRVVVFVILLWTHALNAQTSEVGPINDTSAWDRPREKIADAWRVRKEVMSMGSDPGGIQQLKQIVRLKLQYGLTSLPEVSLSLLKELSDRGGGLHQLEADKLHYAELFSPDLPAVKYWHCSNFALGGMKKCLEGLWEEVTNNDRLLRFLSNLFLVFLKTLTWLCTFLGVFFLIQYAVPVSRVWVQKFPGMTPFGLLLLSGLIVFASWLAIGWIGPAFLLITALWRYCSAMEKGVIVFFSILVALLPFTLLAPALFLRYDRTILPVLENPLQGSAVAENGRKLTNWLAENPNDAEATFTLAAIEKETGRLEKARELYTKVTSIRPTWYKPLVNLANIDFIQGSTADAISTMQKATSLAPDAVGAQFNLGKLLIKETRLDEGNIALKKAKDLDSQRFSELDSLSDPKDLQEFLIDEPLSKEDLFPRIRALSPDVIKIRDRLYSRLFPNLPMIWFWILLIAAPLVGFGIERKWPAGKLDQSDPRRSASNAVNPIDVFDPTASRPKKGQPLKRTWKIFSERWSTLFIPGIHQLFKGNTLSGTVWMFLGILFFVPLAYRHVLLTDPSTLPTLPSFPVIFISLLGFGIVYLIQLANAIRR